MVVDAPVAAVFDLLARPSQHHVFDGSGTVREAAPGSPPRLSRGARFGMRMHWGVPYTIRNEVVEFEEGRRIAWRHLGGHVWRYLLEPEGEGRTRVTEQFDPSGSRAPLLLAVMGSTERNQGAIEATLDRLVAWGARGH
ncbi:MAG: dimethyladenosine transferase [Friedmanniella sp.]|nr:dimethyladenosine transferase [Friedmanniella sp.]